MSYNCTKMSKQFNLANKIKFSQTQNQKRIEVIITHIFIDAFVLLIYDTRNFYYYNLFVFEEPIFLWLHYYIACAYYFIFLLRGLYNHKCWFIASVWDFVSVKAKPIWKCYFLQMNLFGLYKYLFAFTICNITIYLACI